MSTIIGELSLHYEGYGFVAPTQSGHPDVFIPARLMGDAMHGDLVEVTVRKNAKGLMEGSIKAIVQRRLKQMVGRLEYQAGKWSVLSEDQRVRHKMRLVSAPRGMQHGDYVVAKITQYPSEKRPLEGEVIEQLPKRGSLPSEVEYVIEKHQLPKMFPEPVEREASFVKSEAPTRYASRDTSDGRKDLRSLPFITIDGDDAKDFDDAVCAQKLPNDRIRLWVAIADVSHYVQPHSALDKEAYERATSVYFPGRVLPMLPEILSNDLCSLKPHEDRLALVAELLLSHHGEVIEEHFYPAIFQSHARLTYTLVRRLLVDKEESLRKETQFLLETLEILSEAAERLKNFRSMRGSLAFDLPEPEIILDLTGGIEHIEKTERNWSHQIIEELMIAANEAVARFLVKKKVGCVFRVHDGPDPEKISRFYKIVQRLGFQGRFHFPVPSHHLMKILKYFKGHAEMRLINSMLLRSMAQAVYSANNIGHFGLASKCYCHFTSPIRRYPDLIVHRLLKTAWGDAKWRPPEILLEQMSEHCSRQERRSMEAEREMIALHMTLFMQDKLGETYEGVISHVTKFGFFVELIDYFVEGLVPLESLKGDIYAFDQEHLALKGKRHKKLFKIGDRVRITVEEVKLSERRTFLNLLDTKNTFSKMDA